MTTVTTFDHIAIATHRMADAAAVLMGELGGLPAFGGDSGPYRFGQWRFDNGARLEVLEPAGAGGFLHRFLAQHGPGVHHVTFRVPDLRAACARAEAAGYGIVGYDDANPYWQEAFLHPRQAMGIVVQLANPKAMLFFAALLPQFIDPARNVPLQVAILGATTTVTELMVLGGYSLLAGAGRKLATSDAAHKWLERGIGAVFIALAAAAALYRRAA